MTYLLVLLGSLFLVPDLFAQTVDLCAGDPPKAAPVGVPINFEVCGSIQSAAGESIRIDAVRLDVGSTSLIQPPNAISSTGTQAKFLIGPVTLPMGPVSVSAYFGYDWSGVREDGAYVWNESRWTSPFTLLLNEVTPPPPDPTCSVSFGPPSETVLQASGGDGTISLATSSLMCAWVASTPDSMWLTVTPVSGTGSATLTYHANSNTSTTQRQTNIRVGTVASDTITQLGIPPPPIPCSYNITWSRREFPRSGGTAILTIGTTCPWNITDNVDWLRYSTVSGTGSFQVTVTALRYNGRGSRTADVTIAGTKYTLQQVGR